MSACCPASSNRRGPKIIAIVAAALLLVGAVVASQRSASSSAGGTPPGDAAKPPLVSTTPSTDDPSEVVSRMIQAAGDGRLDDYLACFAGDLASQMTGRSQGADRQQLAHSLRQSMQNLKGFSILKSDDPADVNPGSVRVLVDLVFADHNQRQHAVIEKSSGQWRIAALENPQVFIPGVLYGTAVATEYEADAQPLK